MLKKLFLTDNNFIRKDWNALNILTQQASRVGAIDFGVYSINEAENFLQILSPVEFADWRACSEVDIDQDDIETTN